MSAKTEHLPWELISGSKYHARELKPRSRYVTVGCWVLSGLLLLAGVITPYRVAFVFGLLYILTLLMKKDTVVTIRGLEIYYQMRITTHYDFWAWDQIDSILREDRKHPQLLALHFMKGDRLKRLFFTREDAEKILVLAKERNPEIYIETASESQMIGYRKEKKRKKHKTKKNQ